MAGRRFYVNSLSLDRIEVDPDQAGHARKSLRLTVGDEVELFDGQGTIALGRIESIGKSMLVAITSHASVRPLKPRLSLAVALPKGDRAATLVESASQLGVDHLIPISTDRSVVEPGSGKQARFERIAIEAAKQCGRAWLMQIDPLTPLDSLLTHSSDPETLKLIADVQDMHDLSGPDVLTSKIKTAAQVIVLVGPEGGWTDAERAAANAAGFEAWQFGPHILRIETAALAAAAIIRCSQRVDGPTMKSTRDSQ